MHVHIHPTHFLSIDYWEHISVFLEKYTNKHFDEISERESRSNMLNFSRATLAFLPLRVGPPWRSTSKRCVRSRLRTPVRTPPTMAAR
jgi:hypothetical protein